MKEKIVPIPSTLSSKNFSLLFFFFTISSNPPLFFDRLPISVRVCRSGTITLKRGGVPPSGYVGHTVAGLIILTNSPWSFAA